MPCRRRRGPAAGASGFQADPRAEPDAIIHFARPVWDGINDADWPAKTAAEQDRVLFGSDGSPDREVDQFWTPHWRFCETDDEHFDHPAQMLSPLGAPLQGRWRIYGVFLPDDVLRKIYYRNALKYLPSLRASIEKQLAERSR